MENAANTPSQNVTVRWSARIRQFHRRVAVVFTVTVVATTVALMQEDPIEWVSYLPLLPLALLLITGLYLLVLPYLVRRRRVTDGA